MSSFIAVHHNMVPYLLSFNIKHLIWAHQIQSVAYYFSLINMVFKLICAIEIEQGKMDVIFD